MRFRAAGIAALLAFFSGSAAVRSEGALQLSLPLDCEPRKTCFIQNFVDLDAGTGVRDFACGSATYDGHTGVDFRVLSAAAATSGVPVLAAADGVVKARRDGVTDIFMRNAKPGDIKGRECGNGVLIDHGDGWETQYCHMKQGSVAVAKDQTVKRGERLGEVGYSGKADFAHLHLTVRHNGKIIDPFLPDAIDGACQRDGKSAGLWKPEIVAKFRYKAGEIIGAGFAGEPPDHTVLETDHLRVTPVSATSPALLFYGRFLHVSAGDRFRVIITGPGGDILEEMTQPLPRHQAHHVAFAGKKRDERPWPAGRYEGRIELVREGAVIAASLGQAVIAQPPSAP